MISLKNVLGFTLEVNHTIVNSTKCGIRVINERRLRARATLTVTCYVGALIDRKKGNLKNKTMLSYISFLE